MLDCVTRRWFRVAGSPHDQILKVAERGPVLFGSRERRSDALPLPPRVISCRPFLLPPKVFAFVGSCLAGPLELRELRRLVVRVGLLSRRLTQSPAYSGPAYKDCHNHDRQKEDGIAGFERLCTPGPCQDTTEVHEESDSRNEADHASTIGDFKAVAITRPTGQESSARRHPLTALDGSQRRSCR